MASDDTLLKTLLLLAGVVLLLPFLMMALMMPVMGMWGWGWHMGDAGTGSMGVWWPWLAMILPLLIGGIALGYLLYRGFHRAGGDESDPAVEELRVAYARGDLSSEEFEERRDRLRHES